MKKTDLLIFVMLLFFGCVSFLILLLCFKTEIRECFESLTYAIFTGAVIAIPSISIVLYNSKQENSHELHLIFIRVSELIDSNLQSIQLAKKNNKPELFFDSSSTKEGRTELVHIYRLMAEKTNNVFLRKKSLIITIQDSIDNYARELCRNDSITLTELENFESLLLDLKTDVDNILELI